MMMDYSDTSSSSSSQTSSSSARYYTVRTLGSGAFGTVYLCSTHPPSQSNTDDIECSDTAESKHKLVALKTTYQDMKYKNREAEVLKILKHPGIVKVFDIFYTKKRKKTKVATYLNIAMEHFPGTLHDVITTKANHSNGRLSYQDIKWYTLQLFRTVGYLETLSLCHRDIKPHNILVDDSKKVIKMCDFGSAKKLLESESNKHYICSRFYRAPELLCQSTHYSCSVDLWSTGCCMAEMYLAIPLFDGQNTSQQLKLIKNVLGNIPEHYPSRSRTKYTRHSGIAKLSTWKKVLRIKQKEQALKYPEDQLKELKQCHDLQFIQSILQYDPEGRLSLKETLSHPYFSDLCFPTKEQLTAQRNAGYREMEWTAHEKAILQSIQ